MAWICLRGAKVAEREGADGKVCGDTSYLDGGVSDSSEEASEFAFELRQDGRSVWLEDDGVAGIPPKGIVRTMSGRRVGCGRHIGLVVTETEMCRSRDWQIRKATGTCFASPKHVQLNQRSNDHGFAKPRIASP